MSFFGKKFMKVDFENIVELWDTLKVSEKLKGILSRSDITTTFTNNDDGSIQYLVESTSGEKLLDQKIVLDTESEYTHPDGLTSKNIFSLNGDVLKATMTFPDGKVLTYLRTFEGNKFTMEISSNQDDIKAKVFYETV